jgi:hypothetical protein
MNKFNNWLFKSAVLKLKLNIKFNRNFIKIEFYCKTYKNVSISIGKCYYNNLNRKFLSFEKSFSEALYYLNKSEKIGLNDFELMHVKINICKLLDKDFLKNENSKTYILKETIYACYYGNFPNKSNRSNGINCFYGNAYNKFLNNNGNVRDKFNFNNYSDDYSDDYTDDYSDDYTDDYTDNNSNIDTIVNTNNRIFNNSKVSSNFGYCKYNNNKKNIKKEKINNNNKKKNLKPKKNTYIPTLNYDYDQFVYNKNGKIINEIFPPKLTKEEENYETKLLDWALEDYFDGGSYKMIKSYYKLSKYPNSVFK